MVHRQEADGPLHLIWRRCSCALPILSKRFVVESLWAWCDADFVKLSHLKSKGCGKVVFPFSSGVACVFAVFVYDPLFLKMDEAPSVVKPMTVSFIPLFWYFRMFFVYFAYKRWREGK